MPLTQIGKLVEKEFDPEFDNLFGSFRSKKYFLELVAPGTRTEADFRVQINIYEVVRRQGRNVRLREIGYIKCSKQRLKNLAVPDFFLEMGREIRDKINFYETRQRG